MRYDTKLDELEDTLEIIDSEDELKTEFGSNIILMPSEDAQVLVDKLNKYDAFEKYVIQYLKDNYELDKMDIEDLYYNAYDQAGINEEY